MNAITFTPTVGVAPGTTTMQLGRTAYDPYGTESLLKGRLAGAELRPGFALAGAFVGLLAAAGWVMFRRARAR